MPRFFKMFFIAAIFSAADAHAQFKMAAALCNAALSLAERAGQKIERLALNVTDPHGIPRRMREELSQATPNRSRALAERFEFLVGRDWIEKMSLEEQAKLAVANLDLLDTRGDQKKEQNLMLLRAALKKSPDPKIGKALLEAAFDPSKNCPWCFGLAQGWIYSQGLSAPVRLLLVSLSAENTKKVLTADLPRTDSSDSAEPPTLKQQIVRAYRLRSEKLALHSVFQSLEPNDHRSLEAALAERNLHEFVDYYGGDYFDEKMISTLRASEAQSLYRIEESGYPEKHYFEHTLWRLLRFHLQVAQQNIHLSGKNRLLPMLDSSSLLVSSLLNWMGQHPALLTDEFLASLLERLADFRKEFSGSYQTLMQMDPEVALGFATIAAFSGTSIEDRGSRESFAEMIARRLPALKKFLAAKSLVDLRSFFENPAIYPRVVDLEIEALLAELPAEG